MALVSALSTYSKGLLLLPLLLSALSLIPARHAILVPNVENAPRVQCVVIPFSSSSQNVVDVMPASSKS